MSLRLLDVDQRAIVMHTEGEVCSTTRELVESAAFERVVELYVTHLQAHNPAALAAGVFVGQLRTRLGSPASRRPVPRRPPRRCCGSSPRERKERR